MAKDATQNTYTEAEMWSRLTDAVRDHGEARAIDLALDEAVQSTSIRPLQKLAQAMSVSAIALIGSTKETAEKIDSSLLDMRKDYDQSRTLPGTDPWVAAAQRQARLAEQDSIDAISPRDNIADRMIPRPFPSDRFIPHAQPGPHGFDSLGRTLFNDGAATIGRREDGSPLTITTLPHGYVAAERMADPVAQAHQAIEEAMTGGQVPGQLGESRNRPVADVDFDFDTAPDDLDALAALDTWDLLTLEDDEPPATATGIDLQDLPNWQARAQMPDAATIQQALAEVIETPPEDGLTLGSMVARVVQMDHVPRDQYLPMILSYQQQGMDRSFDPTNANALSRLTRGVEAVVEAQQVIEAITVANNVVDGMGGKGNLHYLLGKSGIEASFRTDLKASTSSATGLFQIINSTWLHLVHDHGHKYGMGEMADAITFDGRGRPRVEDADMRAEIMALRYNPVLNAVYAAEYTASNDRGLQARLGAHVQASDADRYLMHFFGGGDGPRFISLMRRSPNAAAAPYFRAPARANRSIFYTRGGAARSLRQVYRLFERKTERMTSLMQQTRQPWLAERGFFTWPDGQEMRLADLPIPQPNPRRVAQQQAEADAETPAPHIQTGP